MPGASFGALPDTDTFIYCFIPEILAYIQLVFYSVQPAFALSLSRA